MHANTRTDVNVLREAGVTNFDRYAYEPGQSLLRDFFLDDDMLVSEEAKQAAGLHGVALHSAKPRM